MQYELNKNKIRSLEVAIKVKQFTDYRSFLFAYIQEAKARNPQWTYGSWSKRLGLKNTSSITKIIQGERNPGSEITEKLINYFRFSGRDAQYFRDLVTLKKMEGNTRMSSLLLEKMGKEHPNGTLKILDDRTFRVISNWFYLPIREMTRMKDFQNDSTWIASKLRFAVPTQDVKQAIKVLKSLGLLINDSKGKLKVAQGRLDTSNDLASEAIKKYHEQMIENAKASVRLVSVESREITGATLVMNSAHLPKAKELIREFRKKFSELFEEELGDSVYQIQVQLFPLTKGEM